MSTVFWAVGTIGLFCINTMFIKAYQISAGIGRFQIAFMNAVSGCIVFISLIALKGFRLQYSLVTLLLAVGYGGFLWIFSSIKVVAAGCGPMTVLTMCCVMGGVLIPTIYGIAVLHERVTACKIIGISLVLFSFLPLLLKSKHQLYFSFKYIIRCVLLLLLNGSLFVVSKEAQLHSEPEYAIDYVALYYFFYFIVAFAVITQQLRHISAADVSVTVNLKNLVLAACIGLFNAGGSICNYRLSYYIPASVQFPLTQASMLVGVTIMSLILYHEKPKTEVVISLAMTSVAIVFVSL